MVVCSWGKGRWVNTFLAKHTAFFNHPPSTRFGYNSAPIACCRNLTPVRRAKFSFAPQLRQLGEKLLQAFSFGTVTEVSGLKSRQGRLTFPNPMQ